MLPPPRDLRQRLKEDGELLLNSPLELMQFTLVYRGDLPSPSKNDSRVDDKHAIRRQLNLQLRDLWRRNHDLSKELHAYVAHVKACQEAGVASFADVKRQWEEATTPLRTEPKHKMRWHNVGPFEFAPLVTQLLDLVCELDILFLRAEPPGSLFTTNMAGDLDNRLKVLFDALRMPRELNELPKFAAPDEQETPFFCLLENDNLITAVRLESERLLKFKEEARNQVELVVRVTVKATRLTWGNIGLVSAS
jgi:hypothetical protein